MSFFLCKLWPYLAGGLIGWLLSGWLARKLKYSGSSTTVEKLVDNPTHLKRISLLEKENAEVATLRSQINTFKSASPKTVDNPKHLKRIAELEKENAEIAALRSKITSLEGTKSKTGDNSEQLNRIAELEKENAEIAALRSKVTSLESAGSKTVDNPKHLNRIAELEKENAEIVTLRSQISSLKGTQSTSTDNSEQLNRIADLEKENAEIAALRSKVTSLESTGSKTVDNPEHLKRISDLEAQLSTIDKAQSLDLKAAKAAGIKIKAEGDFEAIEGIGPKVSEILKKGGITTFSQLSNTSPSKIQSLLNDAGPAYRMINPGTWPDQASLAVNNRWDALKSLQDVLDGGIYPNASSKSGKSDANAKDSADSKRVKDLENQLALMKKGQDIDTKAAKAVGIAVKSDGDFTAIEGVGPKINELLHNAGITTFAELSNASPSDIQKILDDAGSKFNMANPGTWPDQANLAVNNRWGALKALQDVLDGGIYPDGSSSSSNKQNKRISELEAELAKYQQSNVVEIDSDSAKAAGFNLKGSGNQHDFTVIEGIGPKINDIIHNANIHTYSALAAISAADIQMLLDAAGPRYTLADPTTWPAQSDMAANNKWTELMKWQDELDGGKA